MSVVPLYETQAMRRPDGAEGVWLEASDGARLRGAVWPAGARGTALIFHGRTEFIEKHYETVGRLQGLGFAVATLDWRGQGLSERALDDRRKGHIGRFSEYQRDVDALLAEVRRRRMPRPWILIGHSMGGAIAARALMRDAEQPDPNWRIRAAILSAPMLGLSGSTPYLAVSASAARAVSAFGLSQSYAPGGSERPYVELGFDGNVLTSDPARFAAYADLVARHPDLPIGGPTWGWIRAAFSEMPQLRPTRTPMLVFLGDAEQVVSPRAIQNFVRSAPSGRLAMLEGARHEPLFEADAIQSVVWAEIGAFLRDLEI